MMLLHCIFGILGQKTDSNNCMSLSQTNYILAQLVMSHCVSVVKLDDSEAMVILVKYSAVTSL